MPRVRSSRLMPRVRCSSVLPLVQNVDQIACRRTPLCPRADLLRGQRPLKGCSNRLFERLDLFHESPHSGQRHYRPRDRNKLFDPAMRADGQRPLSGQHDHPSRCMRTGSWTSPPQGKRAPRVKICSTIIGVRVYQKPRCVCRGRAVTTEWTSR